MTDKFGDFIEEGKKFVLREKDPPRQWKNAHFSGPGGLYRYWSRFTNTGKGSVFAVDDRGNHCTLIPESGNRTIWFRDDENNKVFSAAGYPVPTEVQSYTCTFDQASTIIKSDYDGLSLSWRCFVPLDEPFEIWTVTIENKSGRDRKISLFPYAEIQIDGFDCPYAYGNWHKTAQFDEESGAMIARNLYPNPNPDLFGAMLMSHPVPIGGAGGNEAFFNPSFSFSHPRLFKGEDLDGRSWAHDETGESLALQIKLDLPAGSTKRADILFGITGDRSHRLTAKELLQNPGKVDVLLKSREDFEENQNSISMIKTGNERLDGHFNHWLKKQMHSYLVYKTGVRDNLQTFSAYCGIDSVLTENLMLKLLSHQYSDGSFPHSWSPLNKKKYSDKPAWLLLTLPEMIKETGNLDFLEAKVPFRDENHRPIELNATVRDHLLRAFQYLRSDRGSQGFHKAHTADWNDDLDGPGRSGGESILVTQIFCAGLHSSAELMKRIGDFRESAFMIETWEELKEHLNSHGWDGSWYRRAYSGNGNVIGSHQNKEGQIYLISQAWALISQTADQERESKLLKSVDEHLDSPLGLKVLHPTYSSFDESVGSLSAALPGFYVNGIYVHANAFMIFADFMTGRADKGWERVMKILPGSPENPLEQSRCEPFALTNCYRSDELQPGLCGDVWHSGSSAWLYTVILEWMAGIRRDYDGLLIDPCLPSHLDELSVERKFRGCLYKFHIKKLDQNAGRECKGIAHMLINDEKINNPKILHLEGRKQLEIEVYL